MSKTLQRSQSVVKPPLPEKPLVQTPDFTGYFSDIEVANLTALESLVFNNEPCTCTRVWSIFTTRYYSYS